MPRVVIVGDRNSGRTTFLGLLYTTQVKSGSDKADDFRFHAGFESVDEITGVFERLMSGGFPDSAAKEGVREVSFRLGYRRPRGGILSRQRSKGWGSDAFVPFHLIVLKAFENEMARPDEASSVTDATLRDALGCEAMVIVVDATKLIAADRDPQLAPLRKFDSAVNSLLTAIQHSRAHGARTVFHPIFLFSKFDRVDPEALRSSNLEGAPPEARKKGPRAAYAKALLDRNLPRTMATVRARERGGLEFAVPSYFFSWVRTDEARPGGVEKVRLRRSGAVRWEPDYASDEYLAFLERLWEIAADIKE